jgi:predicted small secreted protein
MRRNMVVAVALLLSATIAACTSMSGQGMRDNSGSDKSTSDKSMHTGGSSY